MRNRWLEVVKARKVSDLWLMLGAVASLLFHFYGFHKTWYEPEVLYAIGLCVVLIGMFSINKMRSESFSGENSARADLILGSILYLSLIVVFIILGWLFGDVIFYYMNRGEK